MTSARGSGAAPGFLLGGLDVPVPGTARANGHGAGPARPRRGGGTPRRGRCRPAGAAAQARSPAPRRQRRGRARRAGSGGRSRRPRESAASWRAYPDGRAEPPIAAAYRQVPAAARYSAVTPPVTLRRCLMSCVTHVNRRYGRQSGHQGSRTVPPPKRVICAATRLRADDVCIWLMKDLVFDTTVRAVRHRDGQRRQDHLGEGPADRCPRPGRSGQAAPVNDRASAGPTTRS